MKIAVCQINPIIGDFEYNFSLLRKNASRAKSLGCALAVFPEMSVTGYPPKDLLEKPIFISENLKRLEKLCSEVDEIALLCGYVDINPEGIGKSLINTAALIQNRKILKHGGKQLLPSYDVFDETRYFSPAQESLVFELGGKKFGVTICEDIWNLGEFPGVPKYDKDPVASLCEQNIDILVNIAASPYILNKGSLRLNILKKVSMNHQLSTIYCNQVGGNDDLLFDGSSMVVDQDGKLILMGKQFDSDLLVWDTKKSYEEFKDPWPVDEEAILRGLILGTKDYAFKCGFSKVLVGLSGGIDSSLVAFIAKEAMGAENVLGVSMPSPFTSDMSKDDSRKLSENLGINFEEIPIQDLFQTYKDALKSVFKGMEENETEENIQARIRGNLLMAMSNKFNSLLLTTGNKSEFAMGYCTLYGDLSGGLAVISDIPKTLCYRLAHHINRKEEIIPHRIIERPPSAELKPNQTDQDSLPPYEVLDNILELAIEKNLGIEEIVAHGHDLELVRDILRRMDVNEYKRRQAPPGLKMTSKAFGYGRRYPIARGKRSF